MKKTIKETVFCAEEYGSTSWPTNALEFLEWFSEKVSSVPEEYRTTATIRITSDYDIVEMILEYTRSETDAEEAFRTTLEVRNADRKREQELRMLAELKAKYGEGK